ncbi:type IV pilus modification protein PilV [Polaromonas sp. YR568]|uniref:type IV pilus modification protein PilV n=1 Tax=Polaromonas sp. YR568 TaxID=1855301 RepID=UPI00398C1B4B
MPHRQSGATLLEVLVSVLLMSFGVLALAGMQAYAVVAQKNAANRASAGALAAELAELVRLNPLALAQGNYDVALMPTASLPIVPAPLCNFPGCTPESLAARDLASFQSRVRALLPRGGVELARPPESKAQADIWILWEEPAMFAGQQADGTARLAELQSDNCPANAKKQPSPPRCFYMAVQL